MEKQHKPIHLFYRPTPTTANPRPEWLYACTSTRYARCIDFSAAVGARCGVDVATVGGSRHISFAGMQVRTRFADRE